MEFPVPQFIEVEEKIIGPLNFKQVIYLAGAGGLLFILYFIIQIWLFAILAVLIMGTACAFAFIKIGGRPLSKFLTAALAYSLMPRIFIWKKTEKEEKPEKIELQKPDFGIPEETKIEPEIKPKSGLQTISRKIDLGVGK